MTNFESFVRERNEALFSLDRKKIEAYLMKNGETRFVDAPDLIFWAGVYKAICSITNAPPALVKKARGWLAKNGYSASIGF